MFGNRRPEYENGAPVYASEGYAGPPTQVVYEERGRAQPYGRPEYAEGGYGQLGEDGGRGYDRQFRPEYGEGGYGRGGIEDGRGYEREFRDAGYGQPGYVRGGEAGYGAGYGNNVLLPPPQAAYVEQQPYYSSEGSSDLGMGARDSGISAGPDYGAGYGQPVNMAYDGGRQEAEVERLEEEVRKEKRHEREAEVAAAAAVGYGLYEHHEETEAGRGQKKHHGLFGLL